MRAGQGVQGGARCHCAQSCPVLHSQSIAAGLDGSPGFSYLVSNRLLTRWRNMSLRKPADQRKSEIVATMLRLADELGPDRLTTQTVAATVGLTQPAIFRHFPTKQDLWLAVAEMIEDRLTSAWDQALSASSDPLVRIRRLFRASCNRSKPCQQFQPSCFRVNFRSKMRICAMQFAG